MMRRMRRRGREREWRAVVRRVRVDIFFVVGEGRGFGGWEGGRAGWGLFRVKLGVGWKAFCLR